MVAEYTDPAKPCPLAFSEDTSPRGAYKNLDDWDASAREK